MSNIVPVDWNKGGGSSGGPGDMFLYERVEQLEADIAEIKDTVKEIAKDIAGIRLDLAERKGDAKAIEGRLIGLDARLAALPSTWMILTIVFTTWALGSGILIFAINALRK